MNEQKYLSASGAATYLGVDISRIYQLSLAKRVGRKKKNGQWFYSKEDLDTYRASRNGAVPGTKQLPPQVSKPSDDWLKQASAAEYAGMSPANVTSLAQNGKLRRKKNPIGQWVYSVEDLRKWKRAKLASTSKVAASTKTPLPTQQPPAREPAKLIERHGVKRVLFPTHRALLAPIREAPAREGTKLASGAKTLMNLYTSGVLGKDSFEGAMLDILDRAVKTPAV